MLWYMLKPPMADVDCQVADGIATIGWCVWFCFFLLEADGRAMGLL